MDLTHEQKFGFGCMRLPVTDKSDPTSFDYETICQLFDEFLKQGFTYFDTAYTYHSYHGEEAVRRALVSRHPRDSFQLATKMPLRDFKNSDDLEKIFNEQLEHCGVSFFDFYLLHNMGHNVYTKCEKYGAFDFVQRKKSEGKIRVVGMSFHDSPELLDKSWAMRFAASQKGVFRVLSGMNSLEQVADNTKTFKNFKPLTSQELSIIEEVAKIINSNIVIPCTACEYCTHSCPKNIAIPNYFAIYNSLKSSTGSFSRQHVYYNNVALSGHGKAGDCIKCGQCEKSCPQHLPIRHFLEDVKNTFENSNFFPTRK